MREYSVRTSNQENCRKDLMKMKVDMALGNVKIIPISIIEYKMRSINGIMNC